MIRQRVAQAPGVPRKRRLKSPPAGADEARRPNTEEAPAMAISGFGKTRGGDSSLPEVPPASTAGGLTAFIDQGSEFSGKLTFKDTVRIDGRFEGEISSENTLIVGETGEIDANIRSKTVVVSGAVNGDIHASRQLVLHKTARLQGNVETPSLLVEEGAVMNGQLTMSRPDTKGKDAKSSAPLKAVEGDPKPAVN
jgi:cytoskeletal protein CcmA (bactofilin family)